MSYSDKTIWELEVEPGGYQSVPHKIRMIRWHHSNTWEMEITQTKRVNVDDRGEVRTYHLNKELASELARMFRSVYHTYFNEPLCVDTVATPVPSADNSE